MRGTIILVLASFVIPTLTAAVPVIGSASLSVEPVVKRSAKVFDADQAKPRNSPERSPIIEPVLAERATGVKWGGGNNRKRETESTEDLVKRGRGSTWGGGDKRNAEKTVEELVQRGRGSTWGGRKRNSNEAVEELVERGRGSTWGGRKRNSNEVAEELVERGRGSTWGGGDK